MSDQRKFVAYVLMGALILAALAYVAHTAEPAHVDGRHGLTSPL